MLWIRDSTRFRNVRYLRSATASNAYCPGVKTVEKIVTDARTALAEGREPPLPVLTLPSDIETRLTDADLPKRSSSLHAAEQGITIVSPPKSNVEPNSLNALPAHLRTSSTQVEPATPPKWLTYEEAEARVKAANEWIERNGPKKIKKERSGVFGIFGQKDKRHSGASISEVSSLCRGSCADIVAAATATAPLKSALRATPSTPTLRSSESAHRLPVRKSESNLRNFATLPTIAASPVPVPGLIGHDSPNRRRGVYENLLATSGVAKHGEGWANSAPGRMKQSSMASLRDKAKAVFGPERREREPREMVDLAKRSSREARPVTPASALKSGGGVMGLLRSLKGVVGGKKGDA